MFLPRVRGNLDLISEWFVFLGFHEVISLNVGVCVWASWSLFPPHFSQWLMAFPSVCCVQEPGDCELGDTVWQWTKASYKGIGHHVRLRSWAVCLLLNFPVVFHLNRSFGVLNLSGHSGAFIFKLPSLLRICDTKYQMIVQKKCILIIDPCRQTCFFCFALCRCFTKTNGTFSSSPLSVVPLAAPCPQDGLEMKPLGHTTTPVCQASPPLTCGPSPEESGTDEAAPRPAHPACCPDGGNRADSDTTAGAAESDRGTGRRGATPVSRQPSLSWREGDEADAFALWSARTFLKRLGGGGGYFNQRWRGRFWRATILHLLHLRLLIPSHFRN